MAYAKAANGRRFWPNKLRSPVSESRLPSHRTYIVPTGFGFAFGGIAFVLLAMAIGYANNLLYFFVFFLISMALTGMWMTNKNVDLFQIEGIGVDSVFAGEENRLDLHVNRREEKNPLWDIEMRYSKLKDEGEPFMIDEIKHAKKVALMWKPKRRGWARVPRLQIESRFPYKMLRAWKYYDEPTEHCVYPQRKGVDQFPGQKGNHSETEAFTPDREQGLFRDLREFQKSDSPRRIDWKRSLKHQKHLVKTFENAGDQKVQLDWEMTAFLDDFEERISQLAHWVDLCERRHDVYSLKIKDYETGFGSQESHYKTCMQKLALLRPEEVA